MKNYPTLTDLVSNMDAPEPECTSCAAPISHKESDRYDGLCADCHAEAPVSLDDDEEGSIDEDDDDAFFDFS
jgi:hypothetical protein